MAGKKVLDASIPPNKWIRGAHLQKVFNTLSCNFNLYRFLSKNQKKILKESAQQLDQALEADKNLSKKNSSFSKEVSGRLVQTYLLIFSLAMIGVVKERAVFHYQAATEFDNAKFKQVLGEAFVEVFDSGEILVSMATAGLTHMALKAPLEALQNAIGNAKFKTFFKTFMVHLSHTLVSFTGWEFGAQLWKESTFLLDSQLTDPVEREFLKDRNRLFTNIWRALSIKTTVNEAKTNAARKILGLTFLNMVKILIVGTDLNLQWLYNTLRLRMMNGHFVTLVSAMTTASSVGTTLMPGAGTYWGLAFGFFGGLSTIIIPEDYKHSITLGMKNLFKETVEATTGVASFVVLKEGFNANGESLARRGWTLDDSFIFRSSYRKRISNVYIEKIFSLSQLLTQMATKNETFEIEKAKTKDMGRLLSSQESLAADGRTVYAEMFEELTNLTSFYMTETQLIFPLKNNQTKLNWETVEIQQMYVENIYSHFCSLGKGFLHFDPFEADKDPRARRAINFFKSICKVDDVEQFKKIGSMSYSVKNNFDASVRSLDQVRWMGLNESNLVKERLDAVMIGPN